MSTTATKKKKRREKDFLKQLERFFEAKVEPRVKNGFRDLEKILKAEIRLGGIKKHRLLEYDPDSPFSYLSAFLRDKAVASVAPSTKYVVKRVLKAMALERAGVAVEYGPAEGVITKHIVSRLPAGSTLLAVEQNPNFVKAVSRIRDSRLRVVHGDVKAIDKILREQGFGGADVVVSGIPFSYFELHERHELLRKTNALLNPGGRFVAYQFTTHLIPLLKRYFRKVDTQFEIRNLPPHFIFTAYK